MQVTDRDAVESKLMNAYLDGDARALGELHDRIESHLRAIAARFGAYGADADEVLQEAFLRVHTARGGFDRTRPPRPWIARIARNVAIDHAKQRARLVVMSPQAVAERLIARRDPFAETETRGMLIALMAALETLTGSQLQDLETLASRSGQIREVALEQGRSAGAMRASLFRARRRVRRQLERDGWLVPPVARR